MDLRFHYCCIEAWAPLAWLARCRKGDHEIEIWHGRRVEVQPQWFCEAVWPSAFEVGDFDLVDLVVGTGGRLRENRVTFVTSGNTTDRIVTCESANEFLVSNSLPCLLATACAHIDRTYPRYYEDFCTIIQGLRKYKSRLETSVGNVKMIACGYVYWDGGTSKTAYQEVVHRDFGTFARYRAFLAESLSALSDNMTDPARMFPYRPLTTTSSGYDSSAVAVLARQAGCEESICIHQDKSGVAENGAEIAQRVGLHPIHVERDSWRGLDGVEELFIAADGTAEAVALASAESVMSGCVLLTGYHGDKVWAKDTKDLSEDIVRGDASGLSLSEYRLWAGFIHCPVVFWGARQIGDINRLSNSAEMRPWDVPGDYSRPIPRRIVESVGVPRNVFATAKRATAVAFSECLTPTSIQSYQTWLTAHRIEWIRRGRFPPVLRARYERLTVVASEMLKSILRTTPLLWRVERLTATASEILEPILRRSTLLWRLAPGNSLDRPGQLRQHLFAWAVEKVVARYRQGPTSTKGVGTADGN